ILCITLNQATAKVPLYRLADWIGASPLPKWEGINAQNLTRKHFEDALSALCYFTPQKTWENKGYLLQKTLTKAWRGTSREPAGAYYDITKQSYYGAHCPYGQLGHNEDGGTSLVIGFSMVVSKEHHHPILCQALPGGQNDSLSVVSVLEMLQGQGLHNLTLIMDKGMTSKDNVRKIVNTGYHLVGSIKGWGKETIAYASR
ncbi:transposase (IS4), partial [mine drainage metagenome]